MTCKREGVVDGVRESDHEQEKAIYPCGSFIARITLGGGFAYFCESGDTLYKRYDAT